MSTKGNTLSIATRQKISISKTKHTKSHLIQAGNSYIDSLCNESGDIIRPPSVVGYCLEAGISRSRLYELLPIWSELADTIEYIEMLQEDYAINMGFTSKNSIFSMFLLKSKHQYKDQPQQLTQNNTFNVSPELLADALKLMNENK